MQTYKLLNDKFEVIKIVKGLTNALKESRQYKAVSGKYAVIAKHYN
jgi:hypothetical protein